MDESGINLNFELDESDQERILEIVKSDLVDSVLSELPVSELPNFDFYELRSKTVSLSTSLDESPTLQTEVVRSRTQLKQQLMRDQELAKEQERRRINEEEAEIAAQSLEEPISIPINVNNVQVPHHVLEVSSILRNPTRYHILAKRKHRVLKYFSSSDTEDFVSKFDAQKATLQLKQHKKFVQLQIKQKQQVKDHCKKQVLEQKQLQQQQRTLQRRQLQRKRELQLQYQQQWEFNRLLQIQSMEEEEEQLEEMEIMEYELMAYQGRQQRQLYYYQEQQRDEEMEQLRDLRAQHQFERQQLLHEHLMEKRQMQQQFQMEKQQLQQQHEQLKLQEQLLRHQKQKQLLKRAQEEDKAEREALAKVQAEIRGKRRGLSYREPSLEVKTKDHKQKKLQEVALAKAEAALAKAEAGALKEAQAMEQAQAREQPLPQLQLLGQPQVQEPQQDQACALPLDPHNISQRETLNHFISDLTQDPSVAEDKSVDDMVKYDVYYTMFDNFYGPFQWGQGEPDPLSQDDISNINRTKTYPSGLEHYDQKLSLHSLNHAKSRIRKDNHNIVERRRRSIINDRIKELESLLPKVNERYYEVVKNNKNNKGGILKSAVEFIKYLKHEIINLRQLEANYFRIMREKFDMALELEEMRMKHQTCIIVEPHSFAEYIMKDDENDKNESNKSAKSESSSSQGEYMMEEDNSDEDEIC